jgi:hypothetical protein
MRNKHLIALASSVAALTTLSLASSASAAPAAPSGTHPRIWLTASTVSALKANVAKSGSAAAAVVAECQDAVDHPSNYDHAIYEGYGWAYASASCGMAWQLTHDPKFATAGLRIWKALLGDFTVVGDGAGGPSAVTHDAGYGMRYFGAFAALAYDWFHDAPGADALLAQSRPLFKTWVEWYEANGYLKTTAGSNYQAGYLLAKTMIAIAASGEDDGSAASYFTAVVDDMFAKEIVANGVTGKGALVGGDWPEGWEYGPLGALEYAMSARALEEQGAPQPAVRSWLNDLVVNYHYGLTPDKAGFYAGGDYGTAIINATPSPEPLLAAMAGGAGDEASGWAAFVRPLAAKAHDLNLVYDALAEARGATPASFNSIPRPLSYLATGTRKLYARSSWDAAAFWGVFVSAPRFAVDHQHLDASTFVLSRGSDALVFDPSPYGSLSTLTTNALSVDSLTVQDNYRPSQSPYSRAELPWARGTEGGVAAGRAALEGAFADPSGKSDVPFARRDWVFLPEGEIVTIDRVRTDDPARKTYLRFRSPSSFSLGGGNVATASVGASRLVVHPVTLSGGTPQVRSIKGDSGAPCDGNNFGVCTAARVDAGEYAVTLPGPTSLAVHVLDALGASEAASDAVAVSDPALVGVRLIRAGARSFVVASSAKDGQPGATLAYSLEGDSAARHVVFDAPEDAQGMSAVTAKPDGARCAVVITAGGGADAFAGRPLVFGVSAAKDGCKTTVDTSPPPPSAGGGAPPAGDGGAAGPGGTSPSGTGAPGVNGSNPASADGSGVTSGTGGCNQQGGHDTGPAAVFFTALSLLLVRVTRRRPALALKSNRGAGASSSRSA